MFISHIIRRSDLLSTPAELVGKILLIVLHVLLLRWWLLMLIVLLLVDGVVGHVVHRGTMVDFDLRIRYIDSQLDVSIRHVRAVI